MSSTSVHPDIEIFGVYDRGVPNQERIALKVDAGTALNNYFLFLGYTDGQSGNRIWPLADNFLWLTEVRMDVPGWVIIYTGKGSPSISTEKFTNQPLQTLYWNKDNVVLSNPNINPALSSFGVIEIGNKPNQNLLAPPSIPLPPLPPPAKSIEQMLEELSSGFASKK